MTLNIFHLWAEHVVQPSEGPLEGDPSEEEDGEDHVREDGCHVHHVARRGDTLKIEDGQDHVGEDGCHVHHVARRGDTLIQNLVHIM